MPARRMQQHHSRTPEHLRVTQPRAAEHDREQPVVRAPEQQRVLGREALQRVPRVRGHDREQPVVRAPEQPVEHVPEQRVERVLERQVERVREPRAGGPEQLAAIAPVAPMRAIAEERADLRRVEASR
jgi:hypothetical protein